ncbi:MAG: hypothetical protein O4808_04240 [Trichodesmium sp. St17_bin3_1_1]|nr:hypothetical protein [Trichodesmium sp. St17_bin3_1_1]MDE5118707.1 hypothetical protein [Trichodesmium sp. St19_bin1]
MCEIFASEVVIINHSQDSTFEGVLTQDIMEVITLFSTRLYGSKSDKN